MTRATREKTFGQNISIPNAVITRWNSTLRQLKSNLDMKMLSDLLKTEGHSNLQFSAREWCQLNELVELLDPFLEATSLTEGDQVVTIAFALPSVLALVKHLQDVKPRLKHCIPLCNALLASLSKRFRGMPQRVQVPRVNRTDDVSQLPYGSDIYLISTFFDPKFRLRWIDKELTLIDEEKEDLRKEITGI